MRLIDGDTRKLEVALEFSCTLDLQLNRQFSIANILLQKFIDLSDLVICVFKPYVPNVCIWRYKLLSLSTPGSFHEGQKILFIGVMN